MLSETVSHYEVIKKLGEGGMGEVYQARDTSLRRLVALKLLLPSIAGQPGKIARFRQEALAISALNHPHIATIYGIEEWGNRTLLVLEYLPGGSLAQRLAAMRRRGQEPALRQAIEWMIQICEGMAHAHRHGIIHRDIKTANVLFTEEQQVKITDFGLAKMTIQAGPGDESVSLTQSGTVIGTPPCMSPEQAQGQETDERSDIFSLGILLFDLIAGRMPFRGATNLTVMHEVVCMPEPLLSEFRTDLPDGLQAIVSKALQKQPRLRYQTVDEMLADLEALAVEPGSGSPRRQDLMETVSMPGATRQRPRQGRRLGFVMALAVVISVAAGIPGVLSRTTGLMHVQPIPARQRIVVLPFENLGGDPRNRPLTDGLMEVVSNSLTGLEQSHATLSVLPSSDVRKEKIQSAKDSRRMGANLAVEGSVLRQGDNLVVMVNLVDTAANAVLRSGRVKAGISEPDLAERVVAKVAQMLDLALQAQDSQAMKGGSTPVAGASRYYLEGLGYLRHDDRPESVENALTAFQKALKLDPRYVLAYTGAAEAYCRKYEAQKDARSIDAALANSSQALTINGRLAPVHVTMGMVQALGGKYEMAEQEFKEALKLDPHDADAYRELAATYEKTGRADLAEANFKEAIKERPGDWWGLKQLGIFYYKRGRNAEAARYFESLVELTPQSAKAYSNLGAAYRRLGRNSEAAEQFKLSILIEPNANGWGNLGYVYYFDGRFAESAAAYEEATKLNLGESELWGDLADARRWAPALESSAPKAYREAIRLAEKELAINPRQALLRAKEASYWAALGAMEHDPKSVGEYRQRAKSMIAEALKMSRTDESVQFRAALVYEQSQQRGLALRALKSALAAGLPEELVLKDPPLRGLRKDPEFHELLATGKPAAAGQTKPR